MIANMPIRGGILGLVNPEVFINIQQEAEVALLREYDLVASEMPYAIAITGPGLNVTVHELRGHAVLTWELADAAICGWARGLRNDAWHKVVATCFFESGHAIVPVLVTRANGRSFSLMNAFFDMVLDRASAARI